MGFPKKRTRKLIVNGQTYLWHYSDHCPDCGSSPITIGQEDARYYLFIAPYTRDFTFSPKTISKAIMWALSNGWTASNGPSQKLCFNPAKDDFEWEKQ